MLLAVGELHKTRGGVEEIKRALAVKEEGRAHAYSTQQLRLHFGSRRGQLEQCVAPQRLDHVFVALHLELGNGPVVVNLKLVLHARLCHVCLTLLRQNMQFCLERQILRLSLVFKNNIYVKKKNVLYPSFYNNNYDGIP